METASAVFASQEWMLEALESKKSILNAELSCNTWLRLPDGEEMEARQMVPDRESGIEWCTELRKTIMNTG